MTMILQKIKVSLLNKMFKDKEALKAVALAIYVKEHTVGSMVKDWSVNKLHKLTGMSATTVKKRIPKLFELGLVSECGGGDGGKHLSFLSISSKHSGRNLSLRRLGRGTVKEVERGLHVLLIVMLLIRKEYAKKVLRVAENPKSKDLSQLKKAKSLMRRYGWGPKYKEHGLGYKKIAEELGVSLATAFRLVKYAVEELKAFSKETHIEGVRAYGCGNLKAVPPGFSFMSVKHGILYTVRSANTYRLCKDYRICSPHSPLRIPLVNIRL